MYILSYILCVDTVFSAGRYAALCMFMFMNVYLYAYAYFVFCYVFLLYSRFVSMEV